MLALSGEEINMGLYGRRTQKDNSRVGYLAPIEAPHGGLDFDHDLHFFDSPIHLVRLLIRLVQLLSARGLSLPTN